MARLVIVGGSLAGLRAAQGARAAGFAGEIVVVGEERHMPYTRPPLSKGVLAGEATLESVSLPCDELDVTWRLGVRATGLDPQEKIVTLDSGETLAYNTAILATGCRARRWTGPGAELDGLFTLRHLDDALALQDALRDQPKLAIVGAGFIGAEVAASARTLGLDVTLIDIAPLPVPALGQVVGERCAQMHRERGVDLRLGIGIEAFHGDGSGRVREVELGDGTRIAADVVVVALGAIPNTEWLEGSGLTLQPGVLCDNKLQAVEVDAVLCAGDLTAWPHELASGESVRIEHWTNAAEQGTLAGRNAVAPAEERKPYTSVPMFWSDQYDVKMQAVGLPRLAEKVVIVEDDGERFVAIGERAGRVVAAYGWNGARRLPPYRRHISQGATPDDVREAVKNDPRAFRSTREPRHPTNA
jgi:3-phenylpropionate/trans-cinnamate dioxygenase ferredoxin reductase component